MDEELILVNEMQVSKEAIENIQQQLVSLYEKKVKQADLTDLKGKTNFRKARIINPEYFASKNGSDLYVYRLHVERHYLEVFLVSKPMAKILAAM